MTAPTTAPRTSPSTPATPSPSSARARCPSMTTAARRTGAAPPAHRLARLRYQWPHRHFQHAHPSFTLAASAKADPDIQEFALVSSVLATMTTPYPAHPDHSPRTPSPSLRPHHDHGERQRRTRHRWPLGQRDHGQRLRRDAQPELHAQAIAAHFHPVAPHPPAEPARSGHGQRRQVEGSPRLSTSRSPQPPSSPR